MKDNIETQRSTETNDKIGAFLFVSGEAGSDVVLKWRTLGQIQFYGSVNIIAYGYLLKLISEQSVACTKYVYRGTILVELNVWQIIFPPKKCMSWFVLW